MEKLYRVKIDTEKASIVFELDYPITVECLSGLIANNFASEAKIENISYSEYNIRPLR